ncbi:hypothetical protein BU15DRAFT_73091 [Melanogaster broomeanus]|nr:hypothetical protein BU15DRAFT_73091 [Melanogaster broomeanus]
MSTPATSNMDLLSQDISTNVNVNANALPQTQTRPHHKEAMYTSNGPLVPYLHAKQCLVLQMSHNSVAPQRVAHTSTRPLAPQTGHLHLNWATHNSNRPPAPRMVTRTPNESPATSNSPVAPQTGCLHLKQASRTSNGSLAPQTSHPCLKQLSCTPNGLPAPQPGHSHRKQVTHTSTGPHTPQIGYPYLEWVTRTLNESPTTSNSSVHELRDEPHESMGSYPGSRGENDDSRGLGAHCMHVTAQRPQAATGEASTDATNPNMTSIGPPEPVGASREPLD